MNSTGTTDRAGTTGPGPRCSIGCMTGTSLDGLDVAVVEARGSGAELSDVRVVGWASRPLAERGVLAALAAGEPVDAGSITLAAASLGTAHAEACAEAWEAAGRALAVERPALVCVHGQTVFHRPPLSWQLINPWPIAHRLGCPVVFDLRGADLQGGGEGAPITPIADWVLFGSDLETRVIVNLGGFCNATVLPRGGPLGRVSAFDVAPCNQVLDHASRRAIGRPFDPGGSHAAAGRADQRATAELAETLERVGSARDAAVPRRSLGTGDECTAWVDAWLGRLSGPDLLASACAGIGGTIARAIRASAPGTPTIGLAGGSVANRALVGALEDAAGAPVVSVSELGVRGEGGGPVLAEQREAAGFAVLGLLLADGVEIALPRVTGRPGSIPLSGAWIRPLDIPGRAHRQTVGGS